ncbi:winged helix-turn-helix transcriptional regulator [Ruegeria sp.]|uniref:winged helix-turn-helix transcriptional regulator n=1 Tax=Ruegeria sp. TaxID=1879320 RepID=UPI003C7CC2B8
MKAEAVETIAGSAAKPVLLERHCSVRRTVEIVLDSWSFLILREAFFGVKRFDTFQARLGIPRQTLSTRLKKLVENGLLSIGTRDSGRSKQYFFTPRGKDLFGIMLSLMEFGDKWLADDEPPPLQLIHTRCGKACHPITVCSECKTPVTAHDVTYRDGPGAGYSPPEARPVTRRSSDPNVLQRVRPCSVARSLSSIGDRWSFLILREGWFGVRRFDEMREKLGIATNILTDRLNRLVDAGVFRKVPYNAAGDRFEYRFTKMGIDLYKPMLVMMAWGDKWLSDGRPPLRLRHKKCGKDFHAQVVCSECLEPIAATDTDYTLTYTLKE